MFRWRAWSLVWIHGWSTVCPLETTIQHQLSSILSVLKVIFSSVVIKHRSHRRLRASSSVTPRWRSATPCWRWWGCSWIRSETGWWGRWRRRGWTASLSGQTGGVHCLKRCVLFLILAQVQVTGLGALTGFGRLRGWRDLNGEPLTRQRHRSSNLGADRLDRRSSCGPDGSNRSGFRF